MSEESILRLENAMATLAEISAQNNERLAAVEQTVQRLERTTRALEETTRALGETTSALGETTSALGETTSALGETTSALGETIRASGETTSALGELAADHQRLIANLQRRVTGLEESQVLLVEMLRSHHDGLTEMRAAQANADAKIAALAESQVHSDRKLDALIDIVRGSFNRQSENPPE